MREYKITVKGWMLKKSTPDFDFMLQYNNDNPMPLMVMYGYKIAESKRMVKMRLHGDLKDTITQRCMRCGIVITNPVSQYFGLGPKCGGHNYVNPFGSDEELMDAVSAYREKLVSMTWEGWIPNSAITSVDDQPNFYPFTLLTEMELHEDEKPKPAEATPTDTPADESNDVDIIATVDTANRGTEEYSAYLKFRYNASIIDAVKKLPVRFWDGENKQWEILYSELEDLQNALPNLTFKVIGDDKVVKTVTEIPEEFTYKTKPFSHQKEGLKYGMTHDRWLLCDSQGLGKTKQLIDLAVARKYTDGFKHCLIICGVNGLKWNWEEEIATHSNEKSYILGQKFITRGANKGKKYIGSNSDKLNDVNRLADIPEYFIITNVETLRNEKISTALGKACEDNLIGLVAIDEFHMCRNSETKQSEGVLKLQPKYRIGMTGTPLMNTPLDFYQIFKWLGYEPYTLRSFRSHFCIFGGYENREIVGYKNTEDIDKILNKIMLRRTKEQVLDLPEKTYITEYVELTDDQSDTYNDAFAIASATLNTDAEYNPLAEIVRLRQVTGGFGPFKNTTNNPKLNRVEQLVKEAISENDKVVIFSQWTEMTKLLEQRLAPYGIVTITGDTPDSDRQNIVNRFQTDPNIKVFIGSMKAVGVGITLTAASTVIFTDEPWTNGAFEQCVDRCHRIGTTKHVTVHTIMAHGTIDERVHEIMMQKANLSAKMVDGVLTYTRNDVIKYLLTA